MKVVQDATMQRKVGLFYKMETNIYFIRHASIEYTPDDYSRALSEKGKEDVVKLTERFREYKVTKVLSSPYLRAVNTVKAIAEERGLIVETIEDFKERKVSNTFIDDFITFAENQWKDFDYHLEEGESLNQTKARGIRALHQVLEKYKGEEIVVGTHGTMLGVILNHFDSKHHYEFWKALKMPDIYKLTFEDKELRSIENISIV